MPFKSKAQSRLFRAMESRGELPAGTSHEWASHTKNMQKLPERVGEKPQDAKREKAAGLRLSKLAAGDIRPASPIPNPAQGVTAPPARPLVHPGATPAVHGPQAGGTTSSPPQTGVVSNIPQPMMPSVNMPKPGIQPVAVGSAAPAAQKTAQEVIAQLRRELLAKVAAPQVQPVITPQGNAQPSPTLNSAMDQTSLNSLRLKLNNLPFIPQAPAPTRAETVASGDQMRNTASMMASGKALQPAAMAVKTAVVASTAGSPVLTKLLETASICKQAVIAPAIGGGIGALMAPSGNRFEGAARGSSLLSGTATGAGLGIGTGGMIGGGLGFGLGTALGRALGHPTGSHPVFGTVPAALGFFGGGALGASLGGILGGTKGYQIMKKHIGPSSYDPDNENVDRGLAREREEDEEEARARKRKKLKADAEKRSSADLLSAGLSGASGLLDAGLTGGSAELARAYSQRQRASVRSDRASRGVVKGMAGHIGVGLGGMGGTLAGLGVGGGLGLLLARAIGGKNPDPALIALPMAGGLIGGGAGFGLGAYHGGRLGLRAVKNEDDEDEKQDHEKKSSAASPVMLQLLTNLVAVSRQVK